MIFDFFLNYGIINIENNLKLIKAILLLHGEKKLDYGLAFLYNNLDSH